MIMEYRVIGEGRSRRRSFVELKIHAL